MTRRRLFIVQFVLAAALVALALPSSGLALRAQFVYLTSKGPSPAAMKLGAGLVPVWMNQDTVAHTVTFTNGCSVEVAPGANAQCGNGLWNVVGHYSYTVDGTNQGTVNVTPQWRSVTLTATSHAFRRGSKVLLHGTLAIANLSPPSAFGPRMPVRVLERPRGHHLWYPLGVVMAKPLARPSAGAPYSVWSLWVQPHKGTTYKVEVSSQPKAGKYWQTAWSAPFSLSARR